MLACWNSLQKHNQGESTSHGNGPHETQLAIAQFGGTANGITPECRCRQWKNTFQHQHKGKRNHPVTRHRNTAYLVPLARGFFMYLKKSELGSSTMTSLLFLKLSR